MTTGASLKFPIKLLHSKVITISLKLYQLQMFPVVFCRRRELFLKRASMRPQQPRLTRSGRSCWELPSRQEAVPAGTGAQARGCSLRAARCGLLPRQHRRGPSSQARTPGTPSCGSPRLLPPCHTELRSPHGAFQKPQHPRRVGRHCPTGLSHPCQMTDPLPTSSSCFNKRCRYRATHSRQ